MQTGEVMLPEQVDWREVIGKIMAANRWTLPTVAVKSGVKYSTVHYLMTKPGRQPSWPIGAAIYGIYMEIEKK
jgi:hypothetical protein